MKFGKLLALACEGNAQLSVILLRYKRLKKILKSLQAALAQAPPHGTTAGPNPPAAPLPQHVEFIATLNEDLGRFSSFFMEKEEELVIRMEALGQRVKQAPRLSRWDLQVLRMALVDLHGELVLCLHWSLLNSAAFIKIVKKYDKMGTGPMQREALTRVLQAQPFASTSIMQQLMRRAEAGVAAVAARQAALRGKDDSDDADTGQLTTTTPGGAMPQAHPGGKEAPLARLAADSYVWRHTQQALSMWATLGATASTPSTVLPSRMVQQLQANLELYASAAQGPGLREVGAHENDRDPGRAAASAAAAGRAVRAQAPSSLGRESLCSTQLSALDPGGGAVAGRPDTEGGAQPPARVGSPEGSASEERADQGVPERPRKTARLMGSAPAMTAV